MRFILLGLPSKVMKAPSHESFKIELNKPQENSLQGIILYWLLEKRENEITAL